MRVTIASGKKTCRKDGGAKAVKKYLAVSSEAQEGEENSGERGALIWKIENGQKTLIARIPANSRDAFPSPWARVEDWRKSAELDEGSWRFLSKNEKFKLLEEHPEFFTLPELYTIREDMDLPTEREDVLDFSRKLASRKLVPH